MIPIPGIKSVEQAEENAAAMAFGPLTVDELSQVQSITAEYTD
jgi:aryl-alcohol dehydrogenase-like predicted oxidoreductase